MSVAEELKKIRELVTGSRREAIAARTHVPEPHDPVRLEMPIGMQGPPSMRALVQQYVREAVSEQAHSDDLGSFEEEDDFEEEDPELLDLSGYEIREYEMVEEFPQADASPPEGEAVEEPQAPSEAPPVTEPEATKPPE